MGKTKKKNKKNRSMNQKGFIPIIFIVIGAVVVASATFGVVKYKDEIGASVSKIFKERSIEEESEETRQEAVLEELKKEIETLKQQIPEGANKEVLVPKPKLKPGPKPEPKSETKTEFQPDPSIKIELCKNKASQQRADFISLIEKRLQEQVDAGLQKHKDELNNCLAEAENIRDRLTGYHYHPSEISKLVSQNKNICIVVFNDQKDFYARQYQNKMFKYYDEADKFYRETFNECLSQQ